MSQEDKKETPKIEETAAAEAQATEEEVKPMSYEDVSAQIADLKAMVAELRTALDAASAPAEAEEAQEKDDMPDLKAPEPAKEAEVSQENPEDLPEIQEPEDEKQPSESEIWSSIENDVIDE